MLNPNMEIEFYKALAPAGTKTPTSKTVSQAQTKEVMAPEFDKNNRQTVQSMKYGRIDKEYLTKLVMEHKMNVAKYGKGYPMSDELGQVIMIIIDKTSGYKDWARYTTNWMNDMKSLAMLHCTRYLHNFNLVKMKNGKNSDPYYYIGRIVTNAFKQERDDLRLHTKYVQHASLNENILSTCTSMDQYAGVNTEVENANKEVTMGEIGLGNEQLDVLVDTLDRIDPRKKKKRKSKDAKKTDDNVEEMIPEFENDDVMSDDDDIVGDCWAS